MKVYLNWILNDFMKTMDYEYEETFYTTYVQNIKKWDDLLKQVINDQSNEVATLLVLEKIVEESSIMEDIFEPTVRALLETGLITKKSVQKWKKLSSKELSYSSFIEKIVKISEQTHTKLKSKIIDS